MTAKASAAVRTAADGGDNCDNCGAREDCGDCCGAPVKNIFRTAATVRAGGDNERGELMVRAVAKATSAIIVTEAC